LRRSRTRSFGQHFLKDKSVLWKIIEVIAPDEADLIIEIGAGKGALTLPLAKKAGHVIAVEKDRALIPGLRAQNLKNLTVLEADVLCVDFSVLCRDYAGTGKKAKLAGNLPYVISAPILFKILEEKESLSDCVFLLQKEVAERIRAKPGTKAYAPISIRLQNDFSVRLCFTVGPASFSPPPQVQSALVRLEKRDEPLFPVKRPEAFGRFLKTAFRHRRKTLVNNLLMAGHDRTTLETILGQLGIAKNRRPEQVSIPQFVGMFNFFMKNEIMRSWKS